MVDYKRYLNDEAYRQGVIDGRADAAITEADDLKSLSSIRDDREKYRRERDIARQQADDLFAERDYFRNAFNFLKELIPIDKIREKIPEAESEGGDYCRSDCFSQSAKT